MPDIDREAVRCLAIQIGNKAAAEQLGLSYDRVRQWACRYKWNKPHHKPQQPSVTVVANPSDVLGKYEQSTKLSLAKAVNRLAKDSELASLRDSGHVKDVAQTFAIVHPQEQSKTNILNIGILVGETKPERVTELPVIDVE